MKNWKRFRNTKGKIRSNKTMMTRARNLKHRWKRGLGISSKAWSNKRRQPWPRKKKSKLYASFKWPSKRDKKGSSWERWRSPRKNQWRFRGRTSLKRSPKREGWRRQERHWAKDQGERFVEQGCRISWRERKRLGRHHSDSRKRAQKTTEQDSRVQGWGTETPKVDWLTWER